jgi:cytochrome c biogenesis protein CcmG/thiol:disulfide interchange protein DsbE
MKARIAVSLLLLSLTLPAFARKEPPAAGPPAKAPAFSLPARHGSLSSNDLAGKLVYVDFWASWCGPCRMSFPWLKTLHEQYGGKGLFVVAINLDKDHEAAMEFLEDFPAPFVVAFDPGGRTAEAFNVSAMPSSFLVGPDGTILYAQAGFDPKETGKVEQKIKEALSL